MRKLLCIDLHPTPRAKDSTSYSKSRNTIEDQSKHFKRIMKVLLNRFEVIGVFANMANDTTLARKPRVYDFMVLKLPLYAVLASKTSISLDVRIIIQKDRFVIAKHELAVTMRGDAISRLLRRGKECCWRGIFIMHTPLAGTAP